MEVRVPKQLHMPIQILWFYQDELLIIVLMYLAGVLFGGWFWLGLVIGPVIYIRVSRSKPRGYLKHKLIELGFFKLKYYPCSYIREFRE